MFGQVLSVASDKITISVLIDYSPTRGVSICRNVSREMAIYVKLLSFPGGSACSEIPGQYVWL